MKKFGFLLFILALAVGSIASINFNKLRGFGFGNVRVNKTSDAVKSDKRDDSDSDETESSAGKTSSGAKSEKRNLSGFNEIESSSLANTEITVGKDFEVIVEADGNQLANIKTEVSGSTLKIYSEDGVSFKGKFNVKISMPVLTKLDVSGASNLVATNIKGDSFELKSSGACKVKIDGEVKNLNIEASGASKIDAESLKTDNADVDSSGASKITVAPLNQLKAEASGASSVYYSGDPKNIEKSTSGVSSINKK